jgi:hypothetical protein
MTGLKEKAAAQRNMEVTTQPLANVTTSAPAPLRNVDRIRSGPIRGVTRNRSGPMLRGVARNRSGPMRGGSGPMRGVTRNKSGGPRRGVNRTPSRTKALPLKTNSFQRSVPDRASSTSSLRKFRRSQNNGTPIREADDNDFSVASTQTMDSIMVRKKQIGGVPNVAEIQRKRWDDSSVASSTVDLDDGSLHTVDSMAFHQRHLDEGGPDDMSAFSESFVSSSTYLSDYEEGYDLGDDDLPESDQRVDIKGMNNLKIGETDNSRNDDDEEDGELIE